VKLVKINIDENQNIAQQLQIKSIPAVYAFRNGQPVDGFMGALPESEVRKFVKALSSGGGPSPIDQLIEIADEAAKAGDLGTAAQAYGQILQEEPQIRRRSADWRALIWRAAMPSARSRHWHWCRPSIKITKRWRACKRSSNSPSSRARPATPTRCARRCRRTRPIIRRA